MFRRSKKLNREVNSWQDKAANKIAGTGIKLQQKFSTTMNKIFCSMPMKRVKIYFTLFCLVSGGYSVYLTAHSVFGSSKKATAIRVDNLNVPKHFDQKDNDPVTSKQTVTDKMYQEIQNYKRYMDSIGRPIRQSLLDSISLLEEIYHSQTNK
jgi:hypothetical protein